MDRLILSSQENLSRPLILLFLLFELFPSVSIRQTLSPSLPPNQLCPSGFIPFLTSTPCLDTPRQNYSQPDGQGIREELRRWKGGLMAVSVQPLAHRAGTACCSPPGSSLLQKNSVNCWPLPLEDVPDVFFSAKQEISCPGTVKQPLGSGEAPLESLSATCGRCRSCRHRRDMPARLPSALV